MRTFRGCLRDFLVAGASLVVASLRVDSALGDVFEVPSSAFPTIQIALDACGPGDEVHVAPGTYTGDGNVDLRFAGVAVRLLGVAGPHQTILDCAGDAVDPHRGLIFDGGEGPGTIVEGFTIRNGFASGTDRLGGAVVCLFGASPTLRSCVLEQNEAERGGGLFAGDGSSPILIDCTISNNFAGLNGGGVSCMSAASASMTRCRIFQNRSDKHAGGIGCLDDSQVTLIDCEIRGNVASGQGGGLFVDRSSPVLEGVLLAGNVSRTGAGLFVSRTSTLRALAITIAANSAGEEGGGIYLRDGARIDAERTILHANCAPLGEDLRVLGLNGRVHLACSAARPDRMAADPMTLDLGEDLVTGSPRFCALGSCEDGPATDGDYTLDSASPCRAKASPCGQTIGAFEVACGDPVAVRAVSFGRLKSAWR